MPRTFFIVYAGLLGAVVGSFLNVCIYRLPRQCMSILRPGSRCPRCRTPIRWYQNIPILSYLALGGRCATCKAPISLRYPLVELLTGLIFAAIAMDVLVVPGPFPTSNEIGRFFANSTLVAMLLATTIIDLDHRIVPDEISLSGLVIGFVFSLLLPSMHGTGLISGSEHLGAFLSAALGAGAGAGVVFAAGLLGKLLFKKEAMGLGDVKLMAMVGAFLGWKFVLLAFLLACFFGSIFGIVLRLVTRDQYIAFVPYLALGSAVMLFWGHHVLGFVSRHVLRSIPV
ncbi:MAG: prepilin peptidase [Planctomycetota bacterium]|nr:prepilin peptidase [Planctomycetota bacterium]